MKNKIMKPLALSLTALFTLVGCANEKKAEVTAPELTYHVDFNNSDDTSVLDSLIDIIKMSGKGMISGVITDFAKKGINALLNEMGFDTRTITDKKLDNISNQIADLQNVVIEGFNSVMRKQVQIHNEDIMREVLKMITDVRTPIVAHMSTLNAIAEKELSGEVDEKVIIQERTTFAKSVDDLKFTTLSVNKIWNACENLAKALVTPNEANPSLKLFDLYEETFGALEVWDYMTVKPRIQFISYLSFLVNSMAELSKVAAAYEISLLPEHDSNINTIQTGVNNMVDAVNILNEQFQAQILALDEIRVKHDRDSLMTYRVRNSDSEGNIVITEGETISNRLFPVCPGNSEYNYISYDHNEQNRFHDLHYGQYDYENFIFTLDCSSQFLLYETITRDYIQYNVSTGHSDFTEYTIKDYLHDIGFVCYEEELYQKSLGFFYAITDLITNEKDGYVNQNNNLVACYQSFATRGFNMDIYSYVNRYEEYIWSSAKWTACRNIGMSNIYLCFLEADQETFRGEITTTCIDYTDSKTAHTKNWICNYKGKRTWSYAQGNQVKILDEHKIG